MGLWLRDNLVEILREMLTLASSSLQEPLSFQIAAFCL
jgi:hypothetical protein